MKNFLTNLCVITAIAGAGTYFASRSIPQVNLTEATYLCIYFFALTATVHYFILRYGQSGNGQPDTSKNRSFVNRFMLTTVTKFFLSILILVGYVVFNPAGAVPFIILFASYYMFFTAFEVVSLTKHLRSKE